MKRMDDLTGKSVAIYRLVVKDEERDYQGSEESSCGGISQK